MLKKFLFFGIKDYGKNEAGGMKYRTMLRTFFMQDAKGLAIGAVVSYILHLYCPAMPEQAFGCILMLTFAIMHLSAAFILAPKI